MRILQVAPYSPPVRGGIETYVLELSRCLSRRHDVTVFSCGKGETVIGRIRFRRFLALEVNQLPLPFKKHYPIPIRMFFSLLTHNYDVAIVHDYIFITSFLAILACKIRKKPSILKIGTTIADRSTIFKPSKFICLMRAILENTLFRFIIKNATVVVATIRRAQEYISRGYNVKVLRVGHGVDKRRFKPCPLGENLMYIGRLMEIKRVDLLIRAMPIILRNEKVRLTIVGDGPRLSYLKGLAEELGVSDYIEFCGAVPHRDVPKMLRKARIVVVPFHGEINLIEAAMMARPIVTVPLRINREILEDGALYASLGDVRSLADKIIFLLKNPKRAEELGKKAYKIVAQKYDWEIVCKRFERIISSLCKT